LSKNICVVTRFASFVVAAAVCACAAAATEEPVGQPILTDSSGRIANGQTITITGRSFGTKTTPAPLVWEDFSDGAIDPKLVNHGYGPAVINGDNLRHGFSTKNARTDYKTAGAYFGYDEGTARKWFVQYWVKLASNWHWGTSTYDAGDDGLANVKFFRMFPTGDRTYANVGYSTHGFTGGEVLRFVENGVQTHLALDAQSFFTPDAWHCVQIEYGENSGVAQPDGTLRLWVDGKLRDETTTLDTNPADDGDQVEKRPYVIGFYDSWGPSDAAVANMYAYYSDIYVDSSWARVELGDAPTYAASEHREMLIPTSWSPTSISARVAQGSFSHGPAYLYVVNSAGQVNARGLKVIVGSAGNPKSGK